MADIAIAVGQTGSAPQGYTLAGAQEVVLKTLRASYNGAAAGGSFYPSIQIISPGGVVVATYTTPSPVAAGASADVTWFQALGGGGGGSLPAGGALFVGVFGSSPSIAANTTAAIHWDTIQLDKSGGLMWSAADPTHIIAPTDGVYVLSTVLSWPGDAATVTLVQWSIVNSVEGHFADSTEYTVVGTNNEFQSTLTGLFWAPANSKFSVSFHNSTPNTIAFDEAFFWAARMN